MNVRGIFVLAVLALAILNSSCGDVPTTLPPGGSPSPEIIYTSAAETVVSRLTLEAGETAVVMLTRLAMTPIPLPTDEPIGKPFTATPTPSPFIPEPTNTPIPEIPTDTPIPPTSSVPCDLAEFVEDVSLSKGSLYAAGAEFNKIWKVKNIGSCIWDESYDVFFASGDEMGSDETFAFSRLVKPGDTVEVEIELVAPDEEGDYTSSWLLRNGDGLAFGMGLEDAPLQAVIEVAPPPDGEFRYDFAVNFCEATWTSSAGPLTCPGNVTSRKGSVALLDEPELETGSVENELTLWTRPEVDDEGWITGAFPPYRVRDGEHFLADIGCLADSPYCDVTFTLDYQINGVLRYLGSWREVNDGGISRMDIDLSALAGVEVQLVLGVFVMGDDPEDANAFWLVPSIQMVEVIEAPGDDIAAAQAARLMIAEHFGVDLATVTIMTVEPIDWSDTCLGVSLPGQTCSPDVISGYRVILTRDDKRYEAHTNLDGSTIYWFQVS